MGQGPCCSANRKIESTIEQQREEIYLKAQLSKFQNTCSTIKLDFNDQKVSDYGLNRLYELIDRFPRLKEFDVDLSRSNEHVSDSGLMSLCQILNKFPKLTSLHMNLTNCAGISDAGVKDLFEVIMRCLSELQELSLDFRSTKISLESFGSEVGGNQIEGLKKLNLNFEECVGLTSLGVNKFNSTLVKFTQLTDLQLKMTLHSKITDGAIENLCKSFTKLTQLQNLNFKLIDVANKTSDTFLITLSESLPKLTELKELSLKFGLNYTTVEYFAKLTESISKMKKLHQLGIDLVNQKNISDIHLKRLGECLTKLPELKKFSLSLENKPVIYDESITNFFIYFTDLATLKSLSLHFGQNPKLAENVWDKLSEMLFNSKFQSNLQELSLDFNECQFSDAGSSKLCQSLLGMKSLTKLSLGLRQTQITDESMITLNDCIQTLPKLTFIDINISKNTNITDTTLETVSNMLEKLKTLTIANLKFAETQISDKGLITLSSKLVKCIEFSAITSINFDFSACPNISEAGSQIFLRDVNAKRTTVTMLTTIGRASFRKK
jgi:hypothetical protein